MDCITLTILSICNSTIRAAKQIIDQSIDYNLLSAGYLSTGSRRSGYVTLLLRLHYSNQILMKHLKYGAQDGSSGDNFIVICTKLFLTYSIRTL